VNRDFELTVEVERNDILDDQLGIYSPLAEMAGAQAKKLPDDLIVDLLRNGNAAASTTYDGVPFFATNHPINDGSGSTQANYGTSTALTSANYDAKRALMAGYKGADGRPFGVSAMTLVVPPQLEFTAKTIVNAPLNAAGATNVYAGSANVVVIPELAVDALTWYLLDTRWPVKPFAFQNRQPPKMLKKWSDNDDNVFFQKKYVMGVDMRCAGAYGLYWMASKWVGLIDGRQG
jgi:phage major head subunit gpT-like protein